MQLICEADEYRQVGSVNTGSVKYGEVLAYPFCPRTDEACRELLAMLSSFTIGMIMTDEWGCYKREVPVDKYLVEKIFTQRIERNNLTLKPRIKRLVRRTICFSKSVEMHEKVIGAFIEKYMFYCVGIIIAIENKLLIVFLSI
ncbi:hypothetical protein LSE82_003277 [Salmonella enterica]|nr:hypothetical protein [Salmonella enterica]